jgi:hypothetical protein
VAIVLCRSGNVYRSAEPRLSEAGPVTDSITATATGGIATCSVDGDPTGDASATERISMVVLKGERVRRVDFFDAAKNPIQ